ncbi:hypothetical protein KIN20_003608 [Parelaphostrongylus tenuis]|uniref:Uncharacterized protein n=1 Tax=Parelaphostrongylus tenuis TaxID=148309 RepID=A0AAD5LXK9_PARTN|nr:hypothetical protein KIN20_003608 [Parelaphostrongylus tenuis]
MVNSRGIASLLQKTSALDLCHLTCTVSGMTSIDQAAIVVELSKPCTLAPSPIIREAVGKRHADMDDDEAPRAKRRFERVSAQFERFTISGEDQLKEREYMDSPESDGEWSSSDGFGDEQATEGIIEEPDEDSTGRMILDSCLQNYIDRMKKADNFGLPSRSPRDVIHGNELVIWRPLPEVSDPFMDPTMKGRIQEVDDASHASCEASTSAFVTEAGENEIETETPNQLNLPQQSRPRIVEITSQDDDCMDMDCD